MRPPGWPWDPQPTPAEAITSEVVALLTNLRERITALETATPTK